MKEYESRGIDAAFAYLERTGMKVEEADHASPFELQAQDGDVSVAVIVRTRKTALDPLPVTKIRKALKVLADYHDERGEAYRVDLVDIRVLTPDRALLRHHRNVEAPDGT